MNQKLYSAIGAVIHNNIRRMITTGDKIKREAPNLGMLGGSVFGTSGARNPTLTIQALAWRTAERLAKNWKSITA